MLLYLHIQNEILGCFFKLSRLLFSNTSEKGHRTVHIWCETETAAIPEPVELLLLP